MEFKVYLQSRWSRLALVTVGVDTLVTIFCFVFFKDSIKASTLENMSVVAAASYVRLLLTALYVVVFFVNSFVFKVLKWSDKKKQIRMFRVLGVLLMIFPLIVLFVKPEDSDLINHDAIWLGLVSFLTFIVFVGGIVFVAIKEKTWKNKVDIE